MAIPSNCSGNSFVVKMDQQYPTLNIIPYRHNSGFPKLPEDMRYNMSHPRRGVALIFNNKTFEYWTGMGERPGTDVDAAKLVGLFKSLGFETHLHNNCTKRQTIEEVKTGRGMQTSRVGTVEFEGHVASAGGKGESGEGGSKTISSS